MKGWVYAVCHTLSRAFAAASITSLFTGKIEAFGFKLDGPHAASVSLMCLLIALGLAYAESCAEEAKRGRGNRRIDDLEEAAERVARWVPGNQSLRERFPELFYDMTFLDGVLAKGDEADE